MKEKIINIFVKLDRSPEVSCLHIINPQKYDCEGCPYDRGISCDMSARKADYLITEIEKEFGVSLEELAELAKAKRENRIAVYPF